MLTLDRSGAAGFGGGGFGQDYAVALFSVAADSRGNKPQILRAAGAQKLSCSCRASRCYPVFFKKEDIHASVPGKSTEKNALRVVKKETSNIVIHFRIRENTIS